MRFRVLLFRSEEEAALLNAEQGDENKQHNDCNFAGMFRENLFQDVHRITFLIYRNIKQIQK